MRQALLGAAVALVLTPAAWAQEGVIEQLSPHVGEMAVPMGRTAEDISDRLRFEPYQMLDDLFARDDYVLLMRHGPTDWSRLDEENVAPDNCADQRILSPEGAASMRDLGALLAVNQLLPSRIIVSEWCRNQQTVENMLAGMDEVTPGLGARVPVETDPGVNLLLSLQGAPDVTRLRDLIAEWDGAGGRGPLLIISHFTNIEELTTFNVYEGEMLMIDPKRDGRVLGYLRLASARPDIGHFNTE